MFVFINKDEVFALIPYIRVVFEKIRYSVITTEIIAKMIISRDVFFGYLVLHERFLKPEAGGDQLGTSALSAALLAAENSDRRDGYLSCVSYRTYVTYFYCSQGFISFKCR